MPTTSGSQSPVRSAEFEHLVAYLVAAVKILTEVIRIRKQDHGERQEHESLLAAYLHALEDVEPQKKTA